MEEFRNAFLNFLNSNASELVNKEGAMCTNYIVATEWVDTNGEYWTLMMKDENSPVWRHKGLFQHFWDSEFVDEAAEESD